MGTLPLTSSTSQDLKKKKKDNSFNLNLPFMSVVICFGVLWYAACFAYKKSADQDMVHNSRVKNSVSAKFQQNFGIVKMTVHFLEERVLV